MAASTGEELRMESESRTDDEEIASDEVLSVKSVSVPRMDDEGMTSDEEMTSDEVLSVKFVSVPRMDDEGPHTDDEGMASDEVSSVESVSVPRMADEGMASDEEIIPDVSSSVEDVSIPRTADEGMVSDEEMISDEFWNSDVILDTMRDQELGDAFVEEQMDRWERFLELSPEEALAATKGMQQVFDIAKAARDDFHVGRVDRLSDIKDGTALLLAVLGRGVSQCTTVKFGAYPGPLNAEEAIALCANLKSNTNIKMLSLNRQTIFGTPQMCAVLSDALTTNNTLTNLSMGRVQMTPVALRCLLFGGRSRSSWHPTKLETDLAALLCKIPNDYGKILKLRNEIKIELEKLESGGLLANVTLETLEMSWNKLSQTTSLEVFLSKNPTLKSLDVSFSGLEVLSARGLADALKGNANLEGLYLDGNDIGNEGAGLIFESLSQNIREAGPELSLRRKHNTTLKSLHIGRVWQYLSPECLAAALVLLLETNTSLINLTIVAMPSKPELWTQQIFPALSKNKTLQELDLHGCDGLTGDEVCDALFKVVQENNTGLQNINLQRTGMEGWQGRINEELRINADYRDKLRDQSMVPPTSGRLVLCGYEFAGKTTICKTMERICRPDGTGEDVFNTAWKKLMQMVPCLRQILCGTDAPRELGERTRGFDISVIDDGPPRISVWDFAGQKEYYALHDYLFPDIRNSCFVYVCSCRCPPSSHSMIGDIKTMEKMKEDFHFWMRFIASNSKLTGAGDGIHLPYVHFVLTNVDRLSQDQRDLSEKWAGSVVEDMKKDFEQVINLCPTVAVVNSRLAKDVQDLMDVVNSRAQEILRGPSEYKICKKVREALEDWSNRNPCNPIMSLTDFEELCDKQVRPLAEGPYMNAKLDDEAGRRAILSYLNDMGDIIYPERRDSIHPERLDFIVVNPRWFGTGVLGHLIDAIEGAGKSSSPMTTAPKWNGFFGHPRPKSMILHKNGVVTREKITRLLRDSLKALELQDVLTGLSDDKLVQLMIRLELCFEVVPENQESDLFVPALFDDATESAAKGERKLSWSLDDRRSVYLGLRLQCMDTATTFLTPGFFPRLQVHLVNYLRGHPLNVNNQRTTVDRNLIEFTENGMQVFVEYSGDIDYFIDILVKSSKSHAITTQFIEQHLVAKIRDFCASPQGCQGVLLEEALIRPLCVQNLDVCARRNGHSELVRILENNIKEKGNDYMHHWQRIGNETCTDYALDLLKGEGSYKAASSSSGTSGSGPANNQQKSSTRDQLPEYYLSIKDIGFQGRVNAWKGLTPFKLHLYCDGEEGSNRCKVEGQPGRDIALDDAEHGSDLSLIKPFVKFLWGKFGPGISINKWIDQAFDRSSLPDITKKKLEELINSGGTEVPVSEDALVKELEDHIARTPGRLKTILNMDNADNIRKDFRLSRAEFSTPAGKIGWLCDHHYSSARRKNKLKTNTRCTSEVSIA